MKITLINIRGKHSFSPGVPLGIAYLGGILRHDGHEVQLIDLLASSTPEVLKKTQQFNPDLVGFSTMTLNFSVTIDLAKKLKKLLPVKTLFCAGGLHPTAMPEEALKKLPVDFVVMGEGEKAISRICMTLDYKNTGSVAYLDNKGKCIKNPQIITENLDDLPFPAFDLLDMDLYLRPPGFIRGMVFNRVGTVMFSRGCPFHCSYCSSYLMFKGKTRYHSAEYMAKLLKHMKKTYGIDAYYFTDETFSLVRPNVLKLCQKLKSLRLPWGCSTRVNCVDWDLLKLMKSSGCVHIDYGVESGSERVRQKLNRFQKQEYFIKTFEMCKKLGIRQFAQVMVGCPTETIQEVNQTIALLKKIKPTYTMVSIFTPLPGTDAFDDNLKKLRPLKKYVNRLYDFDIANTEFVLANVSSMTKKQILEARSKIMGTMFWQNYRNMITLNHVKLFLKCLLATCYYLPRTIAAIKKAISQKRMEFIIYMLFFNYVTRYRPKNTTPS